MGWKSTIAIPNCCPAKKESDKTVLLYSMKFAPPLDAENYTLRCVCLRLAATEIGEIGSNVHNAERKNDGTVLRE